MSEDQVPDTKVLFRVGDVTKESRTETLWATSLGNNRFKLDNTPFYAYSVSWEDVVYAPFNEDEGFPTFEHLVSKSGNRTVRIHFDDPLQAGSENDQLLQGLVAMGCSYEGAWGKLFCVTVPPQVDLSTVRQFLIENEVNWEHADPTYEELFPNDG